MGGFPPSLGPLARAQAPLAKPLAEFDKLVSELKISSVVGEPIRVGDTAVIPFAKFKFGLGGGDAMMGFGGGMGGKKVPLGVLIVEGDDVRAELFRNKRKSPRFSSSSLRPSWTGRWCSWGTALTSEGPPGRFRTWRL